MDRDLGLAENGDSFTDPGNEDKLGAARFVVAGCDADVTKKDFTGDTNGFQELTPVTTASSLNLQSLVVAGVTDDGPDCETICSLPSFRVSVLHDLGVGLSESGIRVVDHFLDALKVR